MTGVQFIRFRPHERPLREAVTAVPLLTEATGASNLSGGITTLATGTTVPMHSHNTEEMLTILQGKALIEAAGQRFEAEPFDVCYLPAGALHRLSNVGEMEMRVLWIYGSTRPVRILGDDSVWRDSSRQ